MVGELLAGAILPAVAQRKCGESHFRNSPGGGSGTIESAKYTAKGKPRLGASNSIYGEENVKFGCFRCCKKLTIHQSSQSSVAGCLAIVTGQRVPESLIDTFVDQNAHLGTCEQKVLCFFECSDGRITRDGRKPSRKSSSVSPPSR